MRSLLHPEGLYLLRSSIDLWLLAVHFLLRDPLVEDLCWSDSCDPRAEDLSLGHALVLASVPEAAPVEVVLVVLA